jgi:hypothetical protein
MEGAQLLLRYMDHGAAMLAEQSLHGLHVLIAHARGAIIRPQLTAHLDAADNLMANDAYNRQ